MAKQIVATTLFFLALVGAGLAEIFIVKNNFAVLETQLVEAYEKAEDKTLTAQEYDKVWDEWKNRRECIEYFLNHLDFTEMDFRMAECHAYVAQQDFDSAQAQLDVLIELSRHIPHMLIPTPEHIL